MGDRAKAGTAAQSFTRIAIVNRGEAAMRFVRAARELNEQRSEPLRILALYTDAERNAMFVREADEAYFLGPATFVDPRDGERKNGYLDYAALEHTLRAARAEAVWAGWGFVAERPEFADLCARLGIVFIGPDGDMMRRLGDKISAKRLAEQAGVPLAPWSGGPVDTLDDALRHGDAIGYPLMIKAAAGGGGRGIRRVNEPLELATELERARAEALRSFGDATVFLEKAVTGARHVEVQVVADGYDNAWAVGVRDCTLQRRNQKVVEESASTALTDEQDRELRAAAVRLALLAGYRNAGTVEFLYQPDDASFSFMEVNARLQVEHAVTEATTGIDLVKLQLHVAAGGRLEGEPPAPRGHAIEVRLNAEDPERGFLPAPGTLELLRLPGGPGVRVDAGVAEGDVIPAEFDSMIAKLVAWGRDRDEALARLRRALSETAVVIRGGTTNKGFLLDLLDRPEVRAGTVDNTWIDRMAGEGGTIPSRYADVAMVQAAVDAYDAELAVEQARFYTSARRGRPRTDASMGRTIELRHRGHSYSLRVGRIGAGRYRVDLDGKSVHADVVRLNRFEARLRCDGVEHRVISAHHGTDHLVEVDGVPHRMSRDDGGFVRAPAPAVVVAITVEPGQEVAAGTTIAVLESMKMELALRAPFAGRVRDILVGSNVQVDAGTPLVSLEPTEVESEASVTERLVLPSVPTTYPASDVRERCRVNLDTLADLVLGFDVDAAEARRIVADQHAVCAQLEPTDDQLLAGEHRVLRRFADLRALFRPQPDDTPDEQVRSPQEHLHAYLRSLDTEVEGIPARFVEQLRAALTHFGVAELDGGPALRDACYWIFQSHQRVEAQLGVVIAILERRLAKADVLAGIGDGEFRDVLDRLVAATRGRHAVVADLAREVRYRCFDQPLLDAARDASYAEAEAHLASLAGHPDAGDREDHLLALVDCPQPLAPILTVRIDTALPPLPHLMLEVMTRRYYRTRALEHFATLTVDDRDLFTADYVLDGRRVHVVTTHLALTDLPRAAGAVAAHIAPIPPDEEIVVDFYARANELGEPDVTAREISATLERTVFPHPVRHFVVAVSAPGRGIGMDAVQHYTFRPSDGVLVEDETLRGLHPLMAKRLHLWRLANFRLERLPSAQDVYLFHGVGRDNPKDERLFAVAEVRDLTPERDETGRLVALPQLERALLETVEGIRRFQAPRPPSKRLQWNRVRLYVWPPLDLPLDEIYDVARKLAPATAGLGIERVLVTCRMPDGPDGELRERVIRLSNPTGSGFVMRIDDPPSEPMRPLDEYTQQVVQARRRGAVYPYELVQMLAPTDTRSALPRGEFIEHDLDDSGTRLVPVDRPYGGNRAGIVVGITRSFTDRYPEGMMRVALFGDPNRALGSIAEPECRRIIATLDLAAELHVPVEWFALSAGAKIAMDSGTENMDWVAAVLRRLIEFTQAGSEVNVVVTGINVGAQPYWNAEATMLMHTRGILVMTPESAMVLTGKQALDYSGGVSAEDNHGIGGYERIMGPNGQAQYWAPDLGGALQVLLAHYEHSYVAPGERFPRRAATTDPSDRDPGTFLHAPDTSTFTRVGDVFSDTTNPGRKKPFDIRSVMRATVDQDHPPLERWVGMRDADTAVVWDAHLGGYPVALLGIESHPLPRRGPIPADGPEQWTSGTLFPLSSKKIARAVNAASGTHPLVVLANLSGFDGSPESMRSLQLEYGAEIGRAVVNFDGPIVFCVISRFHGGAFVVFSQRLNEGLEIAALEGSHASVIGGAPAAAVVFAHEVDIRARADARVQELEARIADTDGTERARLRAQLAELTASVRSEKLGELAAEFDAIHSVERAQRVGSVHHIIPATSLRSYLIDAVERGIDRTLDRRRAPGDS